MSVMPGITAQCLAVPKMICNALSICDMSCHLNALQSTLQPPVYKSLALG